MLSKAVMGVCKELECKKQASFGYPKGKVEYCFSHKTIGMMNVRHKHCESEGCTTRAEYGNPVSKKKRFCFVHKPSDAIRLRKQAECAKEGCKVMPKYNSPGKKKGAWCSKHRTDEMIRVVGRMCAFRECLIEPVFNYPGECAGVRCKKHKIEGMINVKSKKCTFEGCNITPNYNYPGKTSEERCSTHRFEGMIDVKNRTCAFEGCRTIPNYNNHGEKRGIFCARHKKYGMVDVNNNVCEVEGCYTLASYSVPGKKGNLRCFKHKTKEMIDTKNKCCEADECTKVAVCGYIGKTTTRCCNHMKDGMLYSPNRKCRHNKCNLFACYGLTQHKHKYCFDHKPEGYVCLTNKKCKNADTSEMCLVVDVLNTKGLCRECDPEGHFKFRRKAKEQQVKQWLDVSAHKDYVSYDKTHPSFSECFGKRYRPDFLYDCKTHFVVLEVDEHQHRVKTYECDQRRMCDIAQSLGIPSIFIRYNPDPYKTSGRRYHPREGTRKKYLLDVIRQCKVSPPKQESEYLRVCKLYFDGFNKTTIIDNVDLVKMSKTYK